MKYGLWIEGYSATGDAAQARYLGEYAGSDFADACQAWAAITRTHLSVRDGQPSSWGCRIFDTEPEARRSFG